jgi:hypothetical protein
MEINKKWWTTPRRVIQPILRINDGVIDGRKMVDDLYHFGCNTILQNVGGIMAWYPTKIPYHHVPEGMKSDILGEILDQAHGYGMKVFARFDLSGLRRDAYEDHPEWFYIDQKGKPIVNKGLFSTCPSSTYYQDFFFPIFEEVTRNYKIDGVFFNMFGYQDRDRQGVYHGPCHCEACKKRFKEMYKLPLPKQENLEDPNYFKYLEFREIMYEAHARQIYAYAKEKSEDIAIFEGRGRRAPMGLLGGYADATEVELHWMKPSPKSTEGMPQAEWRYLPGETCRMVRTFGSGYSSTINIFQCGGGRFESHSRGWTNTGLAQAIANGGWPFVAFVGLPWLEDRKTETLIKSLYSFAAEHEEYYESLKSTARIALVWSDLNSRQLLGRTEPMESFIKHYRGWYNVLVKAHIEFDIIDESQLVMPNADRLLETYQLLILPNVALLSDAVCNKIDEFVEHGGKLVATYETGKFDEQGSKRASVGLSCLGVQEIVAQKVSMVNAFFRNANDDQFPSLRETGLIMLNGGYIYTSLQEGTQTLLNLVSEIEYASPEQECLEWETAHPGVISNDFGKGKAVYLPWEVDKLVYQFGIEDHSLLLEDLVRSLIGDNIIVETNAPSWLEVTLHYQAETKRWILQMVNGSGHDGVEFRDPVKMTDIYFRIKAEGIQSVRSMMLRQNIDFQSSNGYVEFTLPKLELYDLVVIESMVKQ